MHRIPRFIGLGVLVSAAAAAGCSGGGEAGTQGSGGSTVSSGSLGEGGASSSTSSTSSTSSASSASTAPSTGSASTSSSTGAGGAAAVVTPGNPGANDVLLAIDSTKDAHPISPYVYGTNQGDLKAEAKGATLTRVGGNRLTAYNWETNASNAGSDYMYQNDTFISSSKVAGEPMKAAAQAASDAGASILMTVPIAGWVSADVNGPCTAKPTTEAEIAKRFFPILPAKGSAFAYPPDTKDGKVYADEFVHYLESQFPNAQTDAARRIFYELDNEPDLWASTHSEIHPNPVTYAELTQKNITFAKAIKAAAPKTLVFGSVNYGWAGYSSLQDAPDANKRDYLDVYLDAMKAAEQQEGKRLIDVLDVHWYPEAQGDGKRIVDEGVTPGEVKARLDAPRSLWDATYTETSWITQYSTQGPIALLPRLLKKIADHYPGTKLAITEYNYGAGNDISGGLAQADVLGVFGKYGLFAGASWLLNGKSLYLFGGLSSYRNYDGKGGAFGDTSVAADASSVQETSVYASIASQKPGNVIVVAINKTTSARKAGITLKHAGKLAGADVYTLTSAGPTPQKGAPLTAVATNAFSYTMPPYSVTTLVFHP